MIDLRAERAQLAALAELPDGFAPEIALILGSGLGFLPASFQTVAEVPYAEIELFPAPLAAGHSGRLIAGFLNGRALLVFAGRYHVYQGLDAFLATVPVRLAAAAGCKSVLLTCAVGAINSQYSPGDFMLVEDHLNLSGISPLSGINPPLFVDMSGSYRIVEFEKLQEIGTSTGRQLRRGVLAYMPGPQYETPTEITALGRLGADAVGMSSTLETIMARACGLQVSALALVTNLAGGNTAQKVSHQDVLDVAGEAENAFIALTEGILNTHT